MDNRSTNHIAAIKLRRFSTRSNLQPALVFQALKVILTGLGTEERLYNEKSINMSASEEAAEQILTSTSQVDVVREDMLLLEDYDEMQEAKEDMEETPAEMKPERKPTSIFGDWPAKNEEKDDGETPSPPETIVYEIPDEDEKYALVSKVIQNRIKNLRAREAILRDEYRTIRDAWKDQTSAMDKQRDERNQRRSLLNPGKDTGLQSAFPARAFSDTASRRGSTFGNPFSATPAHSGQMSLTSPLGRNRRAGMSLYNADMVRSEAEFEEVMRNLAAADSSTDNKSSAGTTANIPAQVLDPLAKVEMRYLDRNHLVTDPIQEYEIGRHGFDWTDEEHALFQRKYALYPKQFGRIAKAMSDKESTECVLYYYQHKKEVDFKALVASKRRKDRRKNPAATNSGNTSPVKQTAAGAKRKS